MLKPFKSPNRDDAPANKWVQLASQAGAALGARLASLQSSCSDRDKTHFNRKEVPNGFLWIFCGYKTQIISGLDSFNVLFNI